MAEKCLQHINPKALGEEALHLPAKKTACHGLRLRERLCRMQNHLNGRLWQLSTCARLACMPVRRIAITSAHDNPNLFVLRYQEQYQRPNAVHKSSQSICAQVNIQFVRMRNSFR
eukprot:1852170-Amphidinium_carterae.2